MYNHTYKKLKLTSEAHLEMKSSTEEWFQAQKIYKEDFSNDGLLERVKHKGERLSRFPFLFVLNSFSKNLSFFFFLFFFILKDAYLFITVNLSFTLTFLEALLKIFLPKTKKNNNKIGEKRYPLES